MEEWEGGRGGGGGGVRGELHNINLAVRSVSRKAGKYMCNYYIGDGYNIASVLCAIPFHVS